MMEGELTDEQRAFVKRALDDAQAFFSAQEAFARWGATQPDPKFFIGKNSQMQLAKKAFYAGYFHQAKRITALQKALQEAREKSRGFINKNGPDTDSLPCIEALLGD